MALGLLAPYIIDYTRDAFHVFLCYITPLLILLKILVNRVESSDDLGRSVLKNITLIPPGMAYNSDMARKDFPLFTILLIFFNVCLFIFTTPDVVDMYVFYPYEILFFGQAVIALFTSAFLNADLAHLLGNMFFLWVFGSAVEGRIGSRRYIVLYFLFIIASQLLNALILWFTAIVQGDSFWDLFTSYHSLGASGAIAGVMGLFAIRCYFSQVNITVPFLLIPFISFPMRMQAVALIILFFAINIDGAFHPVAGNNIGYWVHIGGYLAGIFAAWWYGMYKEAAVESKQFKAAKLSKQFARRQDATEQYLELLAFDPHDITALQHLLSVNKYNEEKSGYWYSRLMDVYVKQNLSKATELFNEHFPDYVGALSPKTQVKLGRYFFNRNEQFKASLCLESASAETGPWQAKALLMLAESYVAIDNIAMAGKTWQSVMDKFPGTDFAVEARQQYGVYRSTN